MKQFNFDYNIFLIGFMGSGKSTVASIFQKEYGLERVEMDQMIVEEQGMPISEIFEKYGEDHFRDIESNTLIELQKKHRAIVSCGGGVVMREENTEHMKKNGRIVLLTAQPETIYERVRHSKERPLLNNNMNVEYISSLMEKRKARYEAAADIVIATDGKNAEQICEEIVTRLSESKNVAMIIAGGVGARVSGKMPKQYIKVLGKPVLAYTMEAFETMPQIDAITIVCQEDYMEDIEKMKEEYHITKLEHIFKGGSIGQESIRNGVYGLEEFYSKDDLILIHDAIRPLVDHEVLEDCIKVARENGNAIVCIPCVTTMLQKERDEQGEAGKGLNSSLGVYPRDLIMETQTPQAFTLELLGKCHREALEKGITNETASCALMTRLGHRVYFSKGSEKNIKITVPEDLDLMESLLTTKSTWREENQIDE